jgi:hypothetical protein
VRNSDSLAPRENVENSSSKQHFNPTEVPEAEKLLVADVEIWKEKLDNVQLECDSCA